jgi:hypothetical protein
MPLDHVLASDMSPEAPDERHNSTAKQRTSKSPTLHEESHT